MFGMHVPDALVAVLHTLVALHPLHPSSSQYPLPACREGSPGPASDLPPPPPREVAEPVPEVEWWDRHLLAHGSYATDVDPDQPEAPAGADGAGGDVGQQQHVQAERVMQEAGAGPRVLIKDNKVCGFRDVHNCIQLRSIYMLHVCTLCGWTCLHVWWPIHGSSLGLPCRTTCMASTSQARPLHP